MVEEDLKDYGSSIAKMLAISMNGKASWTNDEPLFKSSPNAVAGRDMSP